ncbi:MAG: outer membrane lipoprotein carrier protein LolA [Tannerellaceae bacterium]|jgi:outer membrane lipoprotein carrier protein|nr:outer membrane lipoprotein carrier protein LolA [Tannerellaceae bacterium]
MKKLVISLMIACAGIAHASAQEYREASPEQQKLMLERITQASARMKSLACDFEQTKELSILDEKMTSKGRMYYRNDRCVRWEYASPYAYTFVFNNNRILMMQADGKRSVTDVRSNNLFQEIVKIMISSIDGSGLTDSKSFTSTFFTGGNAPMVTLVPLRKDVRRMFASIKLFFTEADYSVDTVVMEESNGDTTIIKLTGKRYNENFSPSLFAVD